MAYEVALARLIEQPKAVYVLGSDLRLWSAKEVSTGRPSCQKRTLFSSLLLVDVEGLGCLKQHPQDHWRPRHVENC